MTKKWPRYLEKYTHHAVEEMSPFKFVFKREAMISKAEELQLKDEVAIKLFYGEVRNNIMNGRYPLASVEESLMFASLQAQVSYVDFIQEKHGNGFIT